MRATRGVAAPTRLKRSAAPAEQAWTLMQQFVDSHNRHGDLAQALGFRLGAGRGKVLFQLRHGAMTLTELAEANGVDAPYATLIVDKLEAHGLVVRQTHPDDRRRKLVTLTSAGRDAIATADAILLRPPRAMGTLRSEELRQLIQLLKRLIEADRPDDPSR
ncbi:MAG: MarR family winged helix-turn-helix transcriptional regulator [Acidimicrobiia bacterium]